MFNKNMSNSIEPKPVEYFCILAGGGVRGTSYVGVFKALEELNIEIKGIAGSSVGAIFAALYAVGHNPLEMYDRIFGLDFETIRDIYVPFGKDFGICKGDNILNWVKSTLESKFYGEKFVENHNKPILFKDIEKDLIIVATDISTSSIKEFSRYTTPDMEIAQAIRASISIPGFFRPVWNEDECFVDGDITKNLPLWVTSKDIIKNHDRILEFRLEADSNRRKISNPIDFFNSVIDTASNVSTEFIIDLYGDDDQFDYVKINTGDTAIIDFSISCKRKKELVEIGYNTTIKKFKNDILNKRKTMLNTYKELIKQAQQIKNLVAQNKIMDAKTELTVFSSLLIKNKKIDKNICGIVEELIQVFIDNTTKTFLFKKASLKNKPDIHKQLNILISSLESKVKESNNFVHNIGKLKSITVTEK